MFLLVGHLASIGSVLALVSILPQIEEQLQSQGDNLPRPYYGADESMTTGGAATEATAQERKANHEETSDEENEQ